jgi:transposase InsO family protein
LGAELSFARVRRPTDNALTERFYGTGVGFQIVMNREGRFFS